MEKIRTNSEQIRKKNTSKLDNVATMPLPGKFSKLSTETEGSSLPVL